MVNKEINTTENDKNSQKDEDWFDPKFGKQMKDFDKSHIQGKHSKSKKVNHTGDFNAEDVRYKSVRNEGDEKGSRIAGTRPGQRKVVTSPVDYTDTGATNQGTTGQACFLLTGEKKENKFAPHHADEPVQKVAEGVYRDMDDNTFVECSSSETAEYAGFEPKIVKTMPTIQEESFSSENSSKNSGSSSNNSNSPPKTIIKDNDKSRERNAVIKRATLNSAGQIVLDIADNILVKNGVGEQKMVGTGQGHYKSVHVDDIAGLKVLGANASASSDNASAGYTVSPVKAAVFAGASAAQANANAYIIEGIEAGARASFLEANASAGVGVTGAYAGAGARYARAEAGIKNTPLQAHVELAGAGAEAGFSLQYAGASMGAHLAEARAGPFAARAGFKIGGGFRNGIPEVDLGPITVPACIVM